MTRYLPPEIRKGWENVPCYQRVRIWVLVSVDWRTPPPVRFALKTAFFAFTSLFFLPARPGSIPVAMACGLAAALYTH